MMVFNVRPGGARDRTGNVGWILGLDRQGGFPLNLQFDTPSQDVRHRPNGNLVFSLTAAGRILEVTLAGELVRHWHIKGKWADKAPPDGSIEIDARLTHHTINLFPNGNLMLLTAEARDFENWPENDIDPDAATRTASVIGDVVLEVAPDGDIVNRWKMLDILDPYRLSYGSCSGYWRNRGFADSFDWCHTNAVTHDASDNSIVASLRTQDCLIKFDCASGELKWILGNPGNWRQPWSDKLLTPVGDLDWAYHQHDCSITPDGNILCFDNGNNQAVPFGDKTPAAECFSRAVEFDVDEEAMTVRQVWSYGDGGNGDEKLFACYQGGAYRLPQTGNTFITFGGVCTIDGAPTDDVENGFARARLVEVTPDNEIVFDMWIDDSDGDDPLPLSSFRAEFVPD